jgi:hypothetical protein
VSFAVRKSAMRTSEWKVIELWTVLAGFRFVLPGFGTLVQLLSSSRVTTPVYLLHCR